MVKPRWHPKQSQPFRKIQTKNAWILNGRIQNGILKVPTIQNPGVFVRIFNGRDYVARLFEIRTISNPTPKMFGL